MRLGRLQMSTSMMLVVIAVVILSAIVARDHFESQQASSNITIHNSYATDISAPRRLSGIVDNIFIGKVVDQKRTFSRVGDDVWTLFDVQVEENIKGSLDGIVMVNQEGGYDNKLSRMILVEGDSLLIPGETYLFATRFHPEGGWHTLVPVYGDIRITSDDHRTHMTSTFRTAVQEEIPYSPQ